MQSGGWRDGDPKFQQAEIVFDAYSGVPVPNPYVDNGPYAHQLKNAFLNGLKTLISDFIKKAGWKNATLSATKDYAVCV